MHNDDQIINKKKELLCINMQKNNVCQYQNICSYAHSLKEQHITNIRKIIYDIINKKEKLNIDLLCNHDVLTNLVQMTNICKRCQQKKCSGGYNCKYGVIDDKYLICYENLVISNCIDKNCKKYHIMDNNMLYDSDEDSE